MFCKYCGNEIADNSKFCPKCGNEIHPIRKMTNDNNAANNADNKDYFVAEDKDNSLKNDDQKDDEAKSKILEDMDRGYTNETTVDDVENNEKSVPQDPDFITYWPITEEVFNEEKQIYEYKDIGVDKSRIASLYYKDAEINGISAHYGMEISFDGESQKIICIDYYLTDGEFQKFEERYGTPDRQYEETKSMNWGSATFPQIAAQYCDDFGTEWVLSEMGKSGKGYIVSVLFN